MQKKAYLFIVVAALKCYTCASNIGDIDQRCVTNASAVESGQITTNCNNQYCTSKRVEYKVCFLTKLLPIIFYLFHNIISK